MTLPEIQPGQFARVAGVAGPADTTIIAHSIWVETDSGDLMLYGTPTGKTASQIELNGQQIDVAADTPFSDHRDGAVCSSIPYGEFLTDPPGPIELTVVAQNGRLRAVSGELYDATGVVPLCQ